MNVYIYYKHKYTYMGIHIYIHIFTSIYLYLYRYGFGSEKSPVLQLTGQSRLTRGQRDMAGAATHGTEPDIYIYIYIYIYRDIDR